jgi:SAM-dependent methyltransferase
MSMNEHEPPTTREARFTFDEVADLYARVRPGYPTPLFDDLFTLAGITRGGRILEIGCGAGQATVGLAGRGFQVLCLEPGPSLARIVRARLAGVRGIDVIPYTFETWPLESESFDLVVSAQAFHWIAPEIRFTKSASALRPNGALAIIGNAVVFERSLVRAALDRLYARQPLAMGSKLSAGWYGQEETIRQLFSASECFGPVTWRRYPWSREFQPDEYVELLRTHSDHRMLPPDQFESLLTDVRRTIGEHDGRITVAYEAHLYVAARTV